jgi:hypothetical protein
MAACSGAYSDVTDYSQPAAQKPYFQRASNFLIPLSGNHEFVCPQPDDSGQAFT